MPYLSACPLGKSTFIKQTAVVVIMAQIGCFVPAQHAVVPIRDQIFSRIGTGDDMEHNLSSFQVEMKEAAHILRSVSDHSLVILDELGRGTSNADGVAIAVAVAEFLLSTAAYTLFVTHYHQVTSLAAMYPNVKNVHFVTTIDMDSSALGYPHKIAEGPCDMQSGYGLLMAESCGFSDSIMTAAREYQRRLKRTYPLSLRTKATVASAAMNMRRATSLVQRLVILKDSTLDDDNIRSYLAGLARNMSVEERRQVRAYALSVCGGVTAEEGSADSPSSKAALATDSHDSPAHPLCSQGKGPVSPPPLSQTRSQTERSEKYIEQKDRPLLNGGTGNDSLTLSPFGEASLGSHVESEVAAARVETTVINLFRSNRSKRKRTG